MSHDTIGATHPLRDGPKPDMPHSFKWAGTLVSSSVFVGSGDVFSCGLWVWWPSVFVRFWVAATMIMWNRTGNSSDSYLTHLLGVIVVFPVSGAVETHHCFRHSLYSSSHGCCSVRCGTGMPWISFSNQQNWTASTSFFFFLILLTLVYSLTHSGAT